MHAIEALLDADGADWREAVDRALSSTIPPTASPHASGRSRRAPRHAMHRWLAVAASIALVVAASIAATSFVRSDHREPANRGTTTTPLPLRAGYTRVVADNGRVGYARNADLRQPSPRNPHQAILWQHNRGHLSTVMPVYNGENQVIGTFHTGSPGATTTCANQNGIGFTVNPPATNRGEETPAHAASAIYRHYGLSDYTKPASQHWQVTSPTPSAALVTAGPLSIHAERLANGTWIVNSGQRCRTQK
jgi:hypothetical protein